MATEQGDKFPPAALRRDEGSSSEIFAFSAARLAGATGALLGWRPDEFWNATPAELAAVVSALAVESDSVAGAGELARLMEIYPDG